MDAKMIDQIVDAVGGTDNICSVVHCTAIRQSSFSRSIVFSIRSISSELLLLITHTSFSGLYRTTCPRYAHIIANVCSDCNRKTALFRVAGDVDGSSRQRKEKRPGNSMFPASKPEPLLSISLLQT